MSTSSKAAVWASRLTLVPPTVIFALIGAQNLVHPAVFLGERGIALTSGLATTIARVGFGAFPLGCSVFILSCLIAQRRVLTGLTFVAIMDTIVLLVRTFGMYADKSVQENMKLIYAEVGLLIITAIGLSIEISRRTRSRKTAQLLTQRLP